jgi:hypothetical protein
MKSVRKRDFKKLFSQLLNHVKETAKKSYALWKENPSHPSLEFKEIKRTNNIWSVRVSSGWRALGVLKKKENIIVWFWIGSHADYDEILNSK